MNKWMKQGMIGLALASAAAAGVKSGKNGGVEPVGLAKGASLMIDALDFAGGSKLKDRMFQANAARDLEIVVVAKAQS